MDRLMYQFGGPSPKKQAAFKLLTEAGVLQGMTFEEFSQVPDEEVDKVIMQIQGAQQQRQQFTGGGYADFADSIGMLPTDVTKLAGQGAGTLMNTAGELMRGDAAADTGRAIASNTVSKAGQGLLAGAAFGPIGMAVGGGLGAIAGLVEGFQAKDAYRQDIKRKQAPKNIGTLSSSVNPLIGAYKYGGQAAERAEVNRIANIQQQDYTSSDRGRGSVAGMRSQRAGYQEGGLANIMDKVEQDRQAALRYGLVDENGVPTNRTSFATGGGTQVQGKFANYNDKKTKGPKTTKTDDGSANIEVEGGEYILGDVSGLKLHGGAKATGVSSMGALIQGAKHNKTNKSGLSKGVPITFEDEGKNPDGVFVVSSYLAEDGTVAKGGGATPKDSMAGRVKPYMEYIKKAEDKGMKDRFHNNPAAVDAAKKEVEYMKDRSLEAKFLHELRKALKSKEGTFNAVMSVYEDKNPNAETSTFEGEVGLPAGAPPMVPPAPMMGAQQPGMPPMAPAMDQANPMGMDDPMMGQDLMMGQSEMDPMMGASDVPPMPMAKFGGGYRLAYQDGGEIPTSEDLYERGAQLNNIMSEAAREAYMEEYGNEQPLRLQYQLSGQAMPVEQEQIVDGDEEEMEMEEGPMEANPVIEYVQEVFGGELFNLEGTEGGIGVFSDTGVVIMKKLGFTPEELADYSFEDIHDTSNPITNAIGEETAKISGDNPIENPPQEDGMEEEYEQGEEPFDLTADPETGEELPFEAALQIAQENQLEEFLWNGEVYGTNGSVPGQDMPEEHYNMAPEEHEAVMQQMRYGGYFNNY